MTTSNRTIMTTAMTTWRTNTQNRVILNVMVIMCIDPRSLHSCSSWVNYQNKLSYNFQIPWSFWKSRFVDSFLVKFETFSDSVVRNYFVCGVIVLEIRASVHPRDFHSRFANLLVITTTSFLPLKVRRILRYQFFLNTPYPKDLRILRYRLKLYCHWL